MTDINDVISREMQIDYLGRYPLEATRDLEILPLDEVAQLLENIPADKTVPFWQNTTSDIGERLIVTVSPDYAKSVLNVIEPWRAADILSGVDETKRETLLANLDKGAARNIRSVLAFPEGSAGSIMDPSVSLYRLDMTAGDVLRRLKESGQRGVRYVYLVDEENRLLSNIELQEVALAPEDTKLSDLAQPVLAFVNGTASITEVVHQLEEHRLANIPVVDLDGHLIGVVRHHALVTAAQSEASSNIQTMFGASKEERALSSSLFAVRKRLPWLEINLLTAFIAAAVVGLFEGTIAKYTALAILLPVVAGQSGNTGAQALAVVMRGLALREIQTAHWLRVAAKEMNVGFINGLAIAATTALGVYIWSQSLGLAGVICVSMVISMIIAGTAGAVIPIILIRIGQDPAQSSSIILTTVTDVTGFFSFLGIATLLARFL